MPLATNPHRVDENTKRLIARRTQTAGTAVDVARSALDRAHKDRDRAAEATAALEEANALGRLAALCDLYVDLTGEILSAPVLARLVSEDID